MLAASPYAALDPGTRVILHRTQPLLELSNPDFREENERYLEQTIRITSYNVCYTKLLRDPALVSELPHIPDSFVPLMGISSVGYLAGKVTRKAGPNISRIISAINAAGALTIRLLGENLSPRAQVTIDGTLLQTEEVNIVPGTPADAEFVTELLVTPRTVSLTDTDKIDVKIVNPDGQSAETTKDKKEVTQPIKNPAGNPAVITSYSIHYTKLYER